MLTKLEQLLSDIDPSRTYDITFARVDKAINTFCFEYSRIDNWDDFKNCLTQFFCHVESTVLCVRKEIYSNSDLQWGRCMDLLGHIYGSSGQKAAFEITRTGAEGGLFSVLRAIALRMAEEYSENEVLARISHYWNQLIPDEQHSAVNEYLDKYGRLLPVEMTEGSAARIRANFPKVLAQHPKTLQQIRRLGR